MSKDRIQWAIESLADDERVRIINHKNNMESTEVKKVKRSEIAKFSYEKAKDLNTHPAFKDTTVTAIAAAIGFGIDEALQDNVFGTGTFDIENDFV